MLSQIWSQQFVNRLLGSLELKRENNIIKTNLKGYDGVNWIQLDHDMIQKQA
jgi:hypothetical protein